jgi:citrate lyase subunit beta / citryl-CoA lyase
MSERERAHAGVIRPRRSVLYMPAANARAIEKATAIPCDAIIFDLEDSVAPDAKQLARQQAVAALASGSYGGRELTVRANGLGTPWGADDIAAAAAVAPAAVVVPKVASPAMVDDVVHRLDAAGATGTCVWAMIETPTAIFDARAIAAHPRVAVLVIGTNDLARELRVPLGVAGRANLTPYLATAVLAAREAGVVVLDGVYNDVRDEAGFAAECRQGVEMGFDGKTLVHPGQVAAANTAWSPTDDDVARARTVIEAFAAAEAEGRGVVTVDGRMVEALHVENARRTLALADAIAGLPD